jgi:hypothetical protein
LRVALQLPPLEPLVQGGTCANDTSPAPPASSHLRAALLFPKSPPLRPRDLRRESGCPAAGAFNTVTGPVHWELLAKARAVDNQLFVATCSPARNPDASYQVRGRPGRTGGADRVCASVCVGQPSWRGLCVRIGGYTRTSSMGVSCLFWMGSLAVTRIERSLHARGTRCQAMTAPHHTITHNQTHMHRRTHARNNSLATGVCQLIDRPGSPGVGPLHCCRAVCRDPGHLRPRANNHIR